MSISALVRVFFMPSLFEINLFRSKQLLLKVRMKQIDDNRHLLRYISYDFKHLLFRSENSIQKFMVKIASQKFFSSFYFSQPLMLAFAVRSAEFFEVDDTVTDSICQGVVVCHGEQSDASLPTDVYDHMPDGCLGNRIEHRGHFVCNNIFCVWSERSCDTKSLQLATAELIGPA